MKIVGLYFLPKSKSVDEIKMKIFPTNHACNMQKYFLQMWFGYALVDYSRLGYLGF